MVSHDHAPRRSDADRLRIAEERAKTRYMIALMKRGWGKRRKGDGGGEAVPVEPNRPNKLSGGAAAALEFDD